MKDQNIYDVIIIGGSYSGLAAGMCLGRSLREVLIMDNGEPCNASTPHSHNFITHDGKKPKEISDLAKQQVSAYPTVHFYKGLSVSGRKTQNGFEIKSQSGETLHSKKLILATGVKDLMPDIKGFKECWGISVLHCPYCHGYEVKHEKTAVIGNGDMGFEFVKMISHWTPDLTLFTNGRSSLTPEQTEKLKKNNIGIVEQKIEEVQHANGYVSHILLENGPRIDLKAIYYKPTSVQHSDLAVNLGCELTDMGLLKIDGLQKTTQAGIYASGDNSTLMRSVSIAVSSGMMAGAMLNKELIEEEFNG